MLWYILIIVHEVSDAEKIFIHRVRYVYNLLINK